MNVHQGGRWSVISWRIAKVNGASQRVADRYTVGVVDQARLAPGDHIVGASRSGTQSGVRIRARRDRCWVREFDGYEHLLDRYYFDCVAPHERISGGTQWPKM